jgi:hypothetical protein
MRNFAMVNFKEVWCFALCALAIWQVAHLLTEENGPWNLILRLRLALRVGALGRLMNCFCCLSLLAALPAALWMRSSGIEFLIQWMALSAVACLLETTTTRLSGRRKHYPLSASYLDKVIRGV